LACMRIDAHQHFWHYDAQRDAWITDEMRVLRRDFLPEELSRELASNGMDASVAVQADQSENETFFLLELAAQHSTIAGVVGWVCLTAPDVAERLARLARFEKLRGFRHIAQSEPDDQFLLRPDFTRGIASLRQFQFTYDILIYPRQLPAALGLIEKFPDQKFVLDHLAKPRIRMGESSPWTEYMRAMGANPNAYCKLSGLLTEADWHHWRADDFKLYLDVAFDAFGTDRLMFGSDWPVCLLAGSYAQVKELIAGHAQNLSVEEKDKIFGKNAARFYGLAASSHGSAAQG